MNTDINQQLEELFNSRYHGAANIKGIRYQIAYSILRAFDLYDNETNASMRLEGIEDVDVNGSRQIETTGFRVSSQYVQVKTSKADWDWGRFAQSKIIDNFLPVWSADPSARLLVVTNFGYAGKLAELVEVCQGRRRLPSTKLTNSLRTLCQRVGFAHVDPIELLNRVSFERMSDEELQSRVQAAIVRWFDLQTANSDLYLLVLMTKFTDLAVERREIRRAGLEALRLSIQENIQLGVNNPAVQNGWIERVRFNPEAQVDDYFEGSNARPGHIVAGLDVVRPPWLERIHEALQRTGTCIVRTSSGQGKSTLLYRYAYQHYQPETTFIIKQLSDESMVGSVKQAIMTRRALGLPILVLVDNVRAGLRYWYKLTAELAGQGIHILVTMREEDWYRYSSEISAFTWEIVTPSLSLAEARQIHKDFKDKNRVAENVSSAEWAFEQVSERKLLIEFTYLITHGQMLANRLSDQVREMERLKEDRAKLHVLRLVSVAQTYEARVTLDSILRHVEFDADPDSTIASLQMEYVLCNEGSCEGLHYVRSQHLCTLLHQTVPLEQTLAELISILDTENLEALVSCAFVDASVDQSHLLKALIERGRKEPLEVVTRITKALYTASEMLYCRKHQAQFDQAIKEIGSGVTILLCVATLPFQIMDGLAELEKILPDNPNLKLLSDLARTFTPRRWDNRIEVRFLQTIIDGLSLDLLQANFGSLGEFLYWCRLPNLNTSGLEQMLAGNEWTEYSFNADLKAIADFLYELRYFAREKYDSLIAANRDRLISRFKVLSETVLVEERGKNIYIEFIVDEGDKALRRPNEQAWERLRHLYKIVPNYQLYCSQGLYASDDGLDRPVDDSHKEPEAGFLKKEIEGSRNAPYLHAVDAHYATKLVYQWQEQWFNLRRDLASLMTQFLRFFQNGSVNLDKLNEAWRELTYRLDHVIPLPDSLKEALASEEKHVKEWASSLGNFLRQLGQSDEKSRLMRHNLRSALKHLPEAQQAFERVTAYTEPYFDLASLNRGEFERYADLADVLDIRVEEPERPLYDFRRLVKERREQRKREFVEAAHTALAPLEQHGFVFNYPRDRLVDFPAVSICVAFEVLNFEFVFEQIAAIISRLANFPLEYHFLYLVPLLNGAIYSPRVWRISADSVAKVIAGESRADPWPMLPLEEPPNLVDVLPDIQHRAPPELDLFSRFYALYTELNSIRNTAHIVMSRLNADYAYDIELGNLYQKRLQKKTDQILKAYSQLSNQMIEFEQELVGPENDTTTIQRVAWLEFCRLCLEKFEALRDDLNVDPSSFKSIGIWQDRELERLFGRYLNAKYRHHLIDGLEEPLSDEAT